MRWRHITWVEPNTRPWVLGRRPIKDATFRLMIKTGWFPHTLEKWGLREIEINFNVVSLEDHKLIRDSEIALIGISALAHQAAEANNTEVLDKILTELRPIVDEIERLKKS